MWVLPHVPLRTIPGLPSRSVKQNDLAVSLVRVPSVMHGPTEDNSLTVCVIVFAQFLKLMGFASPLVSGKPKLTLPVHRAF
jgi:hypothetical protein